MNPLLVLEGAKAALSTLGQATDHIPSTIVPPCSVVGLGPFTYSDMGDSLDLTLTVTRFTSRADDRSGQHKLARAIAPTGDESVKAAIDAAPGLPVDDTATCDTAVVLGGEEIGVAEVGGTSYHAVTFTVSVLG